MRFRLNDMVQAIVKAARLRLRQILMTSFVFILGVLPLVTSSASSAMLGVTLFGLIFTPWCFTSSCGGPRVRRGALIIINMANAHGASFAMKSGFVIAATK
jgi:hypothetical protein